jgi:hypothetical protein
MFFACPSKPLYEAEGWLENDASASSHLLRKASGTEEIFRVSLLKNAMPVFTRATSLFVVVLVSRNTTSQ